MSAKFIQSITSHTHTHSHTSRNRNAIANKRMYGISKRNVYINYLTNFGENRNCDDDIDSTSERSTIKWKTTQNREENVKGNTTYVLLYPFKVIIMIK